MSDRQLNLVVDLFGCPNRCLHCWLGHMPNRSMGENADTFIMEYFSPYFERIAFYSWMREPDYCPDYQARWRRDIAISKNAVPERFELASFYRIVRDESYLPFLKSVGVEKVQLTLFGQTEIVRLYELAGQIRQSRCPQMEFFVHEGSCDGENRKLYPIRIRKRDIPEALIPVYLGYNELLTEAECCRLLGNDRSHPTFPIGDEITLNISNRFDVYYNFTHLRDPWIIGNLKKDRPEELIRRIVSGDTFALRAAKQCTWAELAERFGDPASERVFHPEDYRMFLFNRYLEQ